MQTIRRLVATLLVALLPLLQAEGWRNALQPTGTPLPLELTGREIVIEDEASPQVKYAADVLQRTLQAVSGVALPVKGVSSRTGAPAVLLREEAPGGPPDGYGIARDGEDWVLSGGRRRGVLNAVVALLTEDVGCRWYSRFTPPLLPRAGATLSVVPRRYAPPFEMRSVYICEAWDADWVLMNRAAPIVNSPPLPEGIDTGACYPSPGVWFAHTFARFSPDAELLEERPELFALIAGKRETGNCCLTNSETAEIAAQKIIAILEKHPEAHLISLSQPDGGFVVCECPECQALAQKEGSAAGPLLFFVNAVAAKVRAKRPDVKLSTLAYQQTYHPPKNIRPAEGVVIFLATDRHAWDYPFRAVAETEEFQNALKLWSRIAPEIHIWDYVAGDFSNCLTPAPNFDVVAANLRHYRATQGVTGIFLQDNYVSIGDSRGPMKTWVFTQLLWNPALDVHELERDFAYGYYGAAGLAMQEYNDLLREAWHEYSRQPLKNEKPLELGITFLEKAEPILQRAQAAVADDPILSREVLREVTCLEYQRLRQGRKGFPTTEAHLAAVDVFERNCNDLGIKSLSERGVMENDLAYFRLQAVAQEQAPTEAGVLLFPPLKAALSNQCGKGNASLVGDRTFPSGVAVYQPGAASAWSMQWGCAKELNTGGKWRLKIRIKSKKAQQDGNLVRCGIYYPYRNRVIMEKELPMPPGAEDGFVWLDAGSVELSAGEYAIVFAGAARQCCADGFWVDRVELWPEAKKE